MFIKYYEAYECTAPECSCQSDPPGRQPVLNVQLQIRGDRDTTN